MLEVRTGRNVWIWARTDSDAPQADDVIRSAVSVMSRLLPDVVPGVVPPPSPKAPPDGSRYYLGAARPLDVSVGRKRPPVPPGTTWLAKDNGTFRVQAQNPWFAVVDFDWRGPTWSPEAWPRRKVNLLGFAIDDPLNLDWLLMSATHTGPATRPDGDWTDDAASTTVDTVSSAAQAGAKVGLGLAAVALLVFAMSKGRR
jgi:hypothetical protein